MLNSQCLTCCKKNWDRFLLIAKKVKKIYQSISHYMNFKKIYCDTDWLNIWKLKRIYLKSNKDLNDTFKCLYISFNPSLYTLFYALFYFIAPQLWVWNVCAGFIQQDAARSPVPDNTPAKKRWKPRFKFVYFDVKFRVSASRGRLRFLAVDCISHRNKITINKYRFAQNAVNLTCFDNNTAKFLKPLLCLPINRLRGNQWCAWGHFWFC